MNNEALRDSRLMVASLKDAIYVDRNGLIRNLEKHYENNDVVYDRSGEMINYMCAYISDQGESRSYFINLTSCVLNKDLKYRKYIPNVVDSFYDAENDTYLENFELDKVYMTTLCELFYAENSPSLSYRVIYDRLFRLNPIKIDPRYLLNDSRSITEYAYNANSEFEFLEQQKYLRSFFE